MSEDEKQDHNEETASQKETEINKHSKYKYWLHILEQENPNSTEVLFLVELSPCFRAIKCFQQSALSLPSEKESLNH